MRKYWQYSLMISFLSLTLALGVGCTDDDDDPDPDRDVDVGVDVDDDVMRPDVLDDVLVPDVDPDVDPDVTSDVEPDVEPDVDPGDLETGSLSFAYDNEEAGTFEAGGTPVLDAAGEPAFGTYAMAFAESPANGDYVLFAVSGDEDPRGDLFIIVLEGVTEAGEVDLDIDCEPDATSGCGTVIFARDVDIEQFDGESAFVEDAQILYLGVTGTLNITEFEPARMSGTFSGTALLVDEENGNGEVGVTLDFSDGAFDVPVIAVVDEE